jgi:hypothetical protein
MFNRKNVKLLIRFFCRILCPFQVFAFGVLDDEIGLLRMNKGGFNGM